MARYMLRAKVAKEAMSVLVRSPEDRLAAMTMLLDSVGGTLHNYYFCFGDYDIVLVYELSDHIDAASLSMVFGASGSVTDIETTVLLTMDQAIEAMEKAGKAIGVYVPPGGA